jgi:hypothetical protein
VARSPAMSCPSASLALSPTGLVHRSPPGIGTAYQRSDWDSEHGARTRGQ